VQKGKREKKLTHVISTAFEMEKNFASLNRLLPNELKVIYFLAGFSGNL
jgi:hypothetical protein